METRTVARAVAYNLLAIVVFWLTTFLLTRLGIWIAPEAPSVHGLLQLLGGLGVLALAIRLSVRPATILIGGLDLFLAVELVFHSIFSYRAVQSGPTHMAIMVAAVGGVLLGSIPLPRWLASR
jgi:hypothetical protein